jgi:anti-sigma factor RsiW
VNTSTECERLRLERMALLDGEGGRLSEPDREHLSTCSSCQRWLADLESMTAQFRGLSYPDAQMDLWTAVEGRIRQADPMPSLPHRLWLIGTLLLGWRALELSIDLPIPVVHLLGPLAAAIAIAVAWKVAGDPLAIETWAPELGKGDV